MQMYRIHENGSVCEIESLSCYSVDFEASFETILDSNVRGREYVSEFFSHVLMLGGAFKIAKHLAGELAGGVDAAAFGADTEAFGCALVEVGAVVFLAVRIDSHG